MVERARLSILADTQTLMYVVRLISSARCLARRSCSSLTWILDLKLRIERKPSNRIQFPHKRLLCINQPFFGFRCDSFGIGFSFSGFFLCLLNINVGFYGIKGIHLSIHSVLSCIQTENLNPLASYQASTLKSLLPESIQFPLDMLFVLHTLDNVTIALKAF